MAGTILPPPDSPSRTSACNKVVWSEGLFLRAQHFQQQDRYFERYVETRCHALVPHSWGFTDIEFEHDLLRIGKLGVRRVAGVFPDGTPFRMPEDDPLPAPIDVGADVRGQILNLAVARRTFRPSWLGKATTVSYIVTGVIALVVNYFGEPSGWFTAAVWVSLALTLMSGFEYLYRQLTSHK